MKKIILIIFISLFFMGCTKEEKLQENIEPNQNSNYNETNNNSENTNSNENNNIPNDSTNTEDSNTIPTNTENKVHFVKELNKAIQKGKIIHFYPEKALWPYYEKIRKFKNGAFNFAIRNDVPVIPIVITFRNPKGIRKLFKKKKDVTVKILEPIKYIDEKDNQKSSIEKLKNQTYQAMQESISSLNI